MGQQILSIEPSIQQVAKGQTITVDIYHEVQRDAAESGANKLSLNLFFNDQELKLDKIDYPSTSFEKSFQSLPTADSADVDGVAETNKKASILFKAASTSDPYPDAKTKIATATFTALDNFDGSTVAVKIPQLTSQTYSNAPDSVLDPKTQTLEVENPTPPVFDGGDTLAPDPSVAENTTVVTTVKATDANAADILTYSLVDGDDAALFAIDPATGAVSFKVAPDFEALPADADNNGTYTVKVKVDDGKG
ncbi:MAG: cadherin repeat domain-containing protein, partial [Xenococcaceae cyanobacterium]